MFFKFKTLDQALIDLTTFLKENGVKRETRGLTCYEAPTPVMITVKDPSSRIIVNPYRKWNKYLPYIESLWIAAGINNIEMPAFYVKNLKTFSDDGQYMRAGYGPRIRRFNGNHLDYMIDDAESFSGFAVDQLKFVIDKLKSDISSRQAVITIHDPNKDNFDTQGTLKKTKDTPCTRSLHFQMNMEGQLDIIVHMRSNDLIWGYSAVNFFNFSFMLEYVCLILEVDMGNVHFLTDNLHFYDHQEKIVEDIISSDGSFNRAHVRYRYTDKIFNLASFDIKVLLLLEFEKQLRLKNYFEASILDQLEYNTFFCDWAKVIAKYHKKDIKIDFFNPNLKNLFNE